MSFTSFEGNGSLGGRLVNVRDSVLRICTETSFIENDATTVLAKVRGIRVEEVTAYQ